MENLFSDFLGCSVISSAVRHQPFRLRSHPVVATAAVALLTGLAAHGQISIVVPGGNRSVEGNSSQSQPLSSVPWDVAPSASTGWRYQQVYGAAEFLSAGSDLWITGVNFRTNDNSGNGTGFGTSMPIELRLSTTSKAPDGLDTTYSNNFGTDTVLVYQGVWAFSSNISGAPTPRPFDIQLVLQTPFHYQPPLGNLLMEMKDSNGSALVWLFDAENSGSDSISSLQAVGLTPGSNPSTGSLGTGGLVTEFIAVPEPGTTAVLIGAGALLASLWCSYRKRRLPAKLLSDMPLRSNH